MDDGDFYCFLEKAPGLWYWVDQETCQHGAVEVWWRHQI